MRLDENQKEDEQMEIPKTCILCKHFVFEPRDADYSEYTPGSDWFAFCKKKKWNEMSGDNVTPELYRKNLLTAEGCDCFEMSRDVLKILKERR